jgi:hypothetical protein
MLHEWAADVDRGSDGRRWSHSRELGGIRLVMLDSREGRVLGERPRRMFDDGEWEWLSDKITGGPRHLIVADTLPIFLPQAIHDLERWNDAVAGGAWSPLMKGFGERVRRALDLEHWGAFPHSFDQIVGLMREAGSGRGGDPPASIITLGGDIHHAYLADVRFPPEAGVESEVWQAVCSPFRNALSGMEERIARAGDSRPARALARGLTRSVGLRPSEVSWSLEQEPTFDNQFATLEFDGDSARLRIEMIVPGDWRHPEIRTTLDRELAGPGTAGRITKKRVPRPAVRPVT